jgi:hypothetical protein
MTEIAFALCFALCALAVWRAAHFLIRGNGPLDLIARLRTAFGSSILGHVVDCFYCSSLLFSLLPALWMSNSLRVFPIEWLSLWAVACLLERATQQHVKYVRVTPVSTSYIDKVIRGV